MIPKAFDEVTKQDIDNLIVEARPERRTLEYKLQAPNLDKEQDKYEFLGDISSFANASGGDILYGVKDGRDTENKPTGVAEDAPGVSIDNFDALILQMQNLARSRVEPKIPNLQMKPITGFPTGPVLHVRVPKSYLSPHMVVNEKQWRRFYARGSTGKFILDSGEIRSAYGLSQTIGDKVRRFREERLAVIVSNETPVRLPSGRARFILHVVPISALDPTVAIDLSSMPQVSTSLRPLTSRAYDYRFNFDGFLTWSGSGGDSAAGTYAQLFRNGAIESLEGSFFSASPSDSKDTVEFAHVEKAYLENLGSHLALLKELKVPPPFFVMVTILGLKGYFVVSGRFFLPSHHRIDRDMMILPDILIEDFNTPLEPALQPIFDPIWQASGWSGSPRYKEKQGSG